MSICDLHIHSRFSGGTSKVINLLNIALNAKFKGLEIVGTGDCFHKKWLEELEAALEEKTKGIYRVQKITDLDFVLQSEVEVVWNVNHQTKKVHFIVLVPNLDCVKQLLEKLTPYADFKDGRSKIFLSAEDFIVTLKNVDEEIEIIPSHIFTPYYGIFGTNLDFKSMKSALGEGASYIYAVETGLSADPLMIRWISELNQVVAVSFSDAHSVTFHRIGREATILDMNKITYSNVISAIRNNEIVKTFEFKPSAGKYYYDGHKSTRHSNKGDYFCSPSRENEMCPICHKKLTKGVLYRAYQLKNQDTPSKVLKRYQHIVPLLTLIKEVLGGSLYDRNNLQLYEKIVSQNEGEYQIWEGSSNFEGIPYELITAIGKIRAGHYYFLPGFDGVYGKLMFETVA